MATAETARLIASLELQDHLSAGVKTAVGAVGGLESGLGRLGGALGHAKNQIGGLISGPLGIIGLTGGLYELQNIIRQSTSYADSYAEAIEKMAGVTGLGATKASELVAVFSRFGIDTDTATTRIGFLEKTMGTLTAKGTTYSAFVKQYAFHLGAVSGGYKAAAANAHGWIDAETALEQLADYWTNTGISATEKAALAAKLLGRGYIDMVPILNLGSKGIKDLIQNADDLGLVMSGADLESLQKYHEGMGSLGMAGDALRLQIGIGLAPVMTRFAGDITNWVRAGGAKEVGQWFRQGAQFAQDMGKVIQDDLIPAFVSIRDWWNGLPDDFKKLLIGGIVAQKASSWLFGGGGIIGAATSLLGGLGGTAAKATGLGGVQHVWVDNPGFGAGGAGGVGGLIPKAGPLTGAAATSTVGQLMAGDAGVSLLPALGLGGLALGINTLTFVVGEKIMEITGKSGPQTTRTNPISGQVYTATNPTLPINNITDPTKYGPYVGITPDQGKGALGLAQAAAQYIAGIGSRVSGAQGKTFGQAGMTALGASIVQGSKTEAKGLTAKEITNAMRDGISGASIQVVVTTRDISSGQKTATSYHVGMNPS
jgi:hypothetical protein